jgi:hypothetical protein
MVIGQGEPRRTHLHTRARFERVSHGGIALPWLPSTGAVAERSRADEVAEQDCDGLADSWRLDDERRGTGVTEARTFGVLLTAPRADPHRHSLRLRFGFRRVCYGVYEHRS